MQPIWNLPKIEFVPFPELEESHPGLLVTNSPAWESVSGALQLPVAWMIKVNDALMSTWDKQLYRRGAAARDPEVVYAVGGGLVVDAAKHFAHVLGLPLVCMPTALSVDAFLTPASGVREVGTVRYIDAKPPDRVIIDFDVIASAPESLRAAGICDVLSIATGSHDWKLAHERGQNPPGMQFAQYAYDVAQAILHGVLECAEAAGHGDRDGLRRLLDCLALEVQLCNQLGHSRPEEGSEHYFAYSVENAIGSGLPHSELLGQGIIEIARLQGQDTAPLEKALRACNIPLDRIPENIVRQTLKEFPAYCRRHGMPYGIAHELKFE